MELFGAPELSIVGGQLSINIDTRATIVLRWTDDVGLTTRTRVPTLVRGSLVPDQFPPGGPWRVVIGTEVSVAFGR
ncbi:MAG: hypothetical protein EB107_05885 [Proteobacteria bacterium]|nr:hypothetical protein [Pseudomonadota bacterium]